MVARAATYTTPAVLAFAVFSPRRELSQAVFMWLHEHDLTDKVHVEWVSGMTTLGQVVESESACSCETTFEETPAEDAAAKTAMERPVGGGTSSTVGRPSESATSAIPPPLKPIPVT
jgi:hypothetical protein